MTTFPIRRILPHRSGIDLPGGTTIQLGCNGDYQTAVRLTPPGGQGLPVQGFVAKAGTCRPSLGESQNIADALEHGNPVRINFALWADGLASLSRLFSGSDPCSYAPPFGRETTPAQSAPGWQA